MLFLLLKTVQKEEGKTKLIRRDLQSSEVIDFSGTLFLPKTIQYKQDVVNRNFEKIVVAGKTYQYVTCYNGYCLVGEAREVPVVKGDLVSVSIPAKLFFSKELE